MGFDPLGNYATMGYQLLKIKTPWERNKVLDTGNEWIYNTFSSKYLPLYSSLFSSLASAWIYLIPISNKEGCCDRQNQPILWMLEKHNGFWYRANNTYLHFIGQSISTLAMLHHNPLLLKFNFRNVFAYLALILCLAV